MGVTMRNASYSIRHAGSTDFIVDPPPSSYVTPIPIGANGPLRTGRKDEVRTGCKEEGQRWSGGRGGNGLHENVCNVRIMSGNKTRQINQSDNYRPRSIYTDKKNDYVNPFTGNKISRNHPLSHLYHDENAGKHKT